MKNFLLMVIVLLSLTSLACAADESSAELPQNLPASVDALSWKYFSTLDRNENIFYSPYGINAALSILANGATGETLKELLRALDTDDITKLNADHKKFSALVTKKYRGDNLFAEANLLLVDKKIIGRGLDKNFKRTVTDAYKSDVREANFSGDSNGERQKISRWVNEKTSGFIPDYNSIVTPDTRTDLLNVVCFKGKWQIPFKTSKTTRQDFTNRDGSKVQVDMMRETFDDELAYVADDKFRGIALPYSANAAMYVILPADDNALNVADLWNAAPLDYRANFLESLRVAYAFNGKVVVHLPKFELDIENNLVANFKAMGLAKSFTDAAEYFNIVNGTSLKIDNAKHRAKVKVDEQGTEAAAVTEIAMIETTAMPHSTPPKIIYFHADRPFLFMIRDVDSRVTLFAGVANKF